MSKRTCPDCGKELPAQTPAGLCPNCLLKLAEKAAPDPNESNPPLRPTIRVVPNHLSSEQPGDRIGRYKLLQEIGEGGNGYGLDGGTRGTRPPARGAEGG